mgnify:CR=1 FL=1
MFVGECMPRLTLYLGENELRNMKNFLELNKSYYHQDCIWVSFAVGLNVIETVIVHKY